MLERVSTNRSIILSCLFHKTVIILLTFSSPPSQSFVLSHSVLLLLLLISLSVLLFEGGEEEGTIEKNGARIDRLRKNRGMSEQQARTAVCCRETAKEEKRPFVEQEQVERLRLQRCTIQSSRPRSDLFTRTLC